MKYLIMFPLAMLCTSCDPSTTSELFLDDNEDTYLFAETGQSGDVLDTMGLASIKDNGIKKPPPITSGSNDPVTVPPECDDGDPCTADYYNEETGCKNIEYPYCCEVGSYDCNPPNLCHNSYCVSDGSKPHPYCTEVTFLCEDKNPCTIDSCWQGSGKCTYEDISDCCREDADCLSDDPNFIGQCISTDDPANPKDYPSCMYYEV